MALDLTDHSASGNNLTNVNSVADSADVPFASGNTHSALFTAASSTYLKTGTSPTNLDSLGSTFTVEAWIKVTTVSTPQKTICGIWGTGAITFELNINRNGNGKQNILLSTNGSSVNTGLDGTTAISGANAWNHIAYTYDGATITAYLNGSSNGTTSMSGSLFNSSEPLFIGAGDDGGLNSLYDGNIDEVRIWNIARSGAAIAADYQQQLKGNESGLIGYFPFNSLPPPTAGNMFLFF